MHSRMDKFLGKMALVSSSKDECGKYFSNGDWGHVIPNTGQEEKEVVVKSADIVKKVIASRLHNADDFVVITRNDPKSPLYSVKSFEELHLPDELLQGLYCMGFQSPSKIQESALPILMANPPTNIIAQSQSGTGKTAAFILSALCRVVETDEFPQILILTPTFELACQIEKVAQLMARYKPGIKFKLAVRGEYFEHRDLIREHIVIGTPGKVMDWGLRSKVFDLTKIKVFILDEADLMIDQQGHRNQSIRIQRNLDNSQCQMMLFSATYEQEVLDFAEMIIPSPVIIRLTREEESLDNINQYYVECADELHKYHALANLFGTISMGQAFIFCATRKSAAWLTEKLVSDGHAVALISGDLTVEQRTEVLQRFRDGKDRVLISTNVCARGIDIDQVTIVINYDMPVNVTSRDIDYETYIHRIGRTGRFGKLGLAVNLVEGQHTLRMIDKLEQHFGRRIEKLNAYDIEEIERINQD